MVTADELKAQGNGAFQAGQYQDAIDAFTSAVELAPENHVLYSNRSAAYASLGQHHQALEDAEKVISIKADWPKGYSRKGKALHGLGKLDEAAETYREGLKHDPSNDNLKAGLEQVEQELSQSSSQSMASIFGGLSDPALMTKLAVNPATMAFVTQPDFIEKMGEIQKDPNSLSKHLGDPRIMAALQVAMQLPTSPVATPGQDAPPPGAAYAKTAPSKVQPEEPAEPVAAAAPPQPVEEDVDMEARAEKEAKEKAQAVKQEGNKLYKAKKFDEALSKYDEAIALDEKEMTFWLNKASVYMEMGNCDESVKCSTKAVDVGRSVRAEYKQVAKAFLRMGNAYMKAERYDDAIESYAKSLTESYSDEANKKKKQCHKLKTESEAKAYLDDDKALEAKNEGNDFFREGKYPEALAKYEESLKRKPDNAPVFSNVAACLAKMGQFPRAIENCDKCIELDPTFVKAYTRKGGFQFYLKEYYKAVETYQKALELDPNCAEAKDGVYRTRVAMQSGQNQEERAKHAMADPEIQAIMQDPVIQQVLNDLQSNPTAAQDALKDQGVAAKIQKLVDAGILRTG